MAGGVHPAEWIIPIVGASHVAYNTAAQQVSPRAKIDLPGSSNDKRDTLMEKDRQTLDAARQAEAERQALMPRPQTSDEEYASRQRAKVASDILGGGGRRRVSQTLTSADNTLAGTSAWGV